MEAFTGSAKGPLPADVRNSLPSWINTLFIFFTDPNKARWQTSNSKKFLRYVNFSIFMEIPALVVILYVSKLLFDWGKYSKTSSDSLSQGCGDFAIIIAIIFAIVERSRSAAGNEHSCGFVFKNH